MSSFLDNNAGPEIEVSENTTIVFSGVEDSIGQVPDGNKGDITVSNNGNTWTLNDLNENLNVITGTYSSKVNQAVLIKARKASAGTITKGQVVYITGSSGTHLLVELARADVEATSAYTIGIASTNITNTSDGFVMQNGRLTGLSTLPTATFDDGDALYLSETTTGAYRVGIPEAPNHGVFLGFAVRTSNGGAGEIDVRVDNYQELEELSDVYVTGSNVNDFLVKQPTRWENTTPANVKTILAINNVDNTSDLNKPISTATQAVLDNKLDKNLIITGATKTKITYDSNGLVTAGTDADIADITGLQTTLNAKQDTLVSGTNIKTINTQSILGSGNVNITKTDIGLGNVDNTSDLNKPISTATQTALDGKVDKIAGKGLSTEDYTTAEKNKLAGIETGAEVNAVSSVAGKTGAVSLVKADVGLSNVDNTTDLNKPISTATQTALDAKQDTLVSGTNIKTINGQSVIGSGNLTVTATAAETFETVSKNLKSYPAAFNYTTGTLTSIVYTLPVGTITKTLNYTSGTLTSIVLSGDTPAGIDLTKTLGYTGDTLTSITYT